MRILIVEDEESLAELVANRLKKEKYIVDISNDGEEGLYNALEDADSTYSNIDLNGYKLYVGLKIDRNKKTNLLAVMVWFILTIMLVISYFIGK